MKTSIKLLIGLITAVLLTMVGTGWAFRQQYDQLDHTDPFAQFSKQTLPPFGVVKLVGTQGERFLVQPGTSPILRIQTDHQTEVSYRIVDDTLVVRYKLSHPNDDYNELGRDDNINPTVVISTPVLRAVLVERATCLVANWRVANLTLTQLGSKGSFALVNSTINTFRASMLGNGLLDAEDKNTIEKATVTLKDKASFIVGQSEIADLTLQADSSTTIQVPGALLARIK